MKEEESLLYARTRAPDMGAPAHILIIDDEPLEVQPIIEQLPTGVLVRLGVYGMHFSNLGASSFGNALMEAAVAAHIPTYDA